MYSVVWSRFYQDVRSFQMIHWTSSATMSNVALNTLDFFVVWFQLNLHSIAPQTLIHSNYRNFRCLNELTETWIRLLEVMHSYLVCLIKLNWILSSNAVPSADFSSRLSKKNKWKNEFKVVFDPSKQAPCIIVRFADNIYAKRIQYGMFACIYTMPHSKVMWESK